jgi:hypothetical protein
MRRSEIRIVWRVIVWILVGVRERTISVRSLTHRWISGGRVGIISVGLVRVEDILGCHTTPIGTRIEYLNIHVSRWFMSI